VVEEVGVTGENKIKVENIGPNKIVVCTEMVKYYT
jgi:hypothetical protein